MALHFRLPLTSHSPQPWCWRNRYPSASGLTDEEHHHHQPLSMISTSHTREFIGLRYAAARIVKVRSSTETSVPAVVGQITEVNKDTFWPLVEAAGDKTVVLDMYTQWCGPCKIIAPKFIELSDKYEDVVFMKLDCNQENKPLAKELGIKVVPTFKILKNNKVVKEVTGAKLDDLVAAIEIIRSSDPTTSLDF